MTDNIHATCINILGKGVLILGASGSGKSDLALRLIASHQAKLVADDRVEVEASLQGIIAAPPPTLKGLLEVRGVGIIKLKALPQTPLHLVVELTSEPLERMPVPLFYELCGINLPLLRLNPFELSAPAKILAALSLL